MSASPFFFSATAEISYASAAAKTDGHPAGADDNRHLTSSLAVAEHLLHARGIGFDIVIDMFGIRLTGAVGIGSALFAVDDDLHGASVVGSAVWPFGDGVGTAAPNGG